jgi:hypothetical protein
MRKSWFTLCLKNGAKSKKERYAEDFLAGDDPAFTVEAVEGGSFSMPPIQPGRCFGIVMGKLALSVSLRSSGRRIIT